jgi:hypothetical protein
MAAREGRPEPGGAGQSRKRGAVSLSRRQLVEGAVAAALLLGGLLAATARLHDGKTELDHGAQVLIGWRWSVFEHAARRIAAPDMTSGGSVPTADELDVTRFVDGWLSRMSGRVVRDFTRFLAYLEHFAPLGCGLLGRFTHLTAAEQDRVLSSLEASRSDLLRAGFEGVKALAFMGFYRDPRTWSVLGYDGPFVGRPVEGWH